MIRIKSSDDSVVINSLGTIDEWEQYPLITFEHPIYLIVFQDHTRLDSICRHLDVSSPVFDFECGSTKNSPWVSYKKNIEDLQFCCRIQLTPGGLKWNIKIESQYMIDHRFGLVYPIDSSKIYSLNQRVNTDVSNYFKTLEQTFRDQTLLQMPIISSQSPSGWLSCFTDPDSAIQFFVNHDDNNLRSTFTTTHNNQGTVHFKCVKHLEENRAAYVSVFPKTDIVLNKWKKHLSTLEERYKIKARCFYGDNSNYRLFSEDLSAKEPDSELLTTFCTTLSKELLKYHKNIFQLVNIHGLFFCSDLVVEASKQEMHGGCVTYNWDALNWIIFDVSKGTKWLIHHEIYHAIEKKIDAKKIPPENESILQNEFGLQARREPNKSEFWADIFGLMMLKDIRLTRFRRGNQPFDQQLLILEELVCPFILDMHKDSSQVADPRAIYRLTDEDTFEQIPFGMMKEGRLFLSHLDAKLLDKINEYRNM